MKKTGRLIAAVAAAFALAGASAAGTASAAPIPCSTWQYNVDYNKPIYSSGAGLDEVGRSVNGGFVNVVGFSDSGYRYGNFYTASGQRYQTEKWIHLTHIHYVRCW